MKSLILACSNFSSNRNPLLVNFGHQFVVFAVVRGIFAEFRTVVRTVSGVSACFEVFCPKNQENHLM